MQVRVLGVLSVMALSSFLSTAVMADEKDDLRQSVREILLENPEIVIEAIEAYQLNQEEAKKRQFKQQFSSNQALLSGENVLMAGNPDGDVTVVEFFDYNCGYCKRAADDVLKLVENDKNVKVIFKEYPILSPASHLASRWAAAAKKQDKYYEYHMALMNFRGQQSVAALEKIGKDVGLDVKKLKKDADSKEIREMIETHIAFARDLGISGTPAFVVNGELNPGYMGYDRLKQAVDDARIGDDG